MMFRIRRAAAVFVTALVVMPGLVAAATAPAAATSAGGAATDSSRDLGRLMLVLDSSGSMKEAAGGGGSKIAAAKSALHRVVGDLPDDADVGLRVFGATVFSRRQKGACTDSQLVVQPGTGNRDELDRAVSSYKPFGETPIGYALRKAADDLGSEGTRSIVLVSDGEATCAPDPCVVARELAGQGIDLHIDVVGLDVSGKARAQLRCIAANGNGRYYDANSADEITQSISKVADRAVRPFQIEGTPIKGGDTSDAATPVRSGTWSDTVGPSGSATSERWYRYDRLLDRSTLLAGVSLLTGAGGIATNSIGIEVTTEDGDLCAASGSSAPVNAAALYGVGTFVGVDAQGSATNQACLTKPLLIKVDRAIGGSKTDSRFSLRLAEEPEVTNADTLPATLSISDATYQAPQISGPTESVTGGQSFGDATTITDGAYRGTIVPGETQVFKIKVGWGQQLAAKVLTPAATPALEKAGLSQNYASLQIFNPMGMIDPDQPTGSTGVGVGTNSLPESITGGTVPVRWKNRFATGASYLAGYYYLVYSADRDAQGDSAEMPYTLRVQVQGEESGAPTYADGQGVDVGNSPGAAPGKATAAKPSGSVAQPNGSDQGLATPLRLAAACGLGLVALACVAGAVLFFRSAQ